MASSAAFGQSGLGSRLDGQEQKLTQDEQTCREVNLAEYAQLLNEASQNKQRAERAKKKGVPVDETQVNADLAKAMQLFARAQAAQARHCMMQAQQQAQPQTSPQAAVPGGTCPAGGPPATPAGTDRGGPRIPTQDEINHTGDLLEKAVQENHYGEAGYLTQELEQEATRLDRIVKDARHAGEFSNVDVKEAEARLRQIQNWRDWGRQHVPAGCLPRQAETQPQPPAQPQQGAMNLSPFAHDVLAAHNAARQAAGVPPLQWNDELAQHAAEWASQLARTRQLQHAPREGRGAERENMLSAPNGYSPGQMMALWTREGRNFVPGTFPNISTTGDWSAVSHYSQIIWPDTTQVGCGLARGGGFQWVDCRYLPGGNKDGQAVGTQEAGADAFNNWIRARPVGGDYGFDGALFVGYDLGAFRLEAEAAYKRVSDAGFPVNR